MPDDFEQLPEDLEQELENSYLSGLVEAALQMNISPEDVIGKANPAAAAYAKERAAEAVTMISDTTKSTLADIIAQSFEDPEATMESITEAIDGSGIFSPGRAAMIATTEVARAQMQGSVSTWRLLGVTKVNVLLSADDPCSECEDIADNGPYDLEEIAFQYPFHPNCQCTLMVVE